MSPSRSGPGPSSRNGNSLHRTVVDVPSAAVAVEVFVVLGFLASFFIGNNGVIPLFLAGVTSSLLGLTSPEILLAISVVREWTNLLLPLLLLLTSW